MSLAFKCDRCGKFYMLGEVRPKGDNWNGGIERCHVNYNADFVRRVSLKTYCPDCMLAFDKFEEDLDMPYRPTAEELICEISTIAGNEYDLRVCSEYINRVYRPLITMKREARRGVEDDDK